MTDVRAAMDRLLDHLVALGEEAPQLDWNNCPEQGIGDHDCVEHEEPAEGCFRCGHDPLDDHNPGGCTRCDCSSPFGGLT